MVDTLTLTIQLSEETRAFIRERIERGEYSSESDYVAQSIEAMKDDTEALERWSQGSVKQDEEEWIDKVLLPSYDEMISHPQRGIPFDQVEDHLKASRSMRRKSA